MTETRLIQKNHPAIIGVGNVEIVIKLQSIQKEKTTVPLVAKVSTWRHVTGPTAKTHYIAWPAGAVPFATELTSYYFRQKGFPVPAMYALPFGGPTGTSCWCTVTENLQRKGWKLSEANRFAFKKLQNGQALEIQLKKYTQRLKQMQTNLQVMVNRHMIEADPLNPFRQCFFVRWNQKTKIGELIMGDIDHIYLGSRAPRYEELLEEIKKRNPTPGLL